MTRIAILTDRYLAQGYPLGQAIAYAVQDVTQPKLEIHDIYERQFD